MGFPTPIDKKEVEQFQLLVTQLAFFSENRKNEQFSDDFPPELAAALTSVGAGIVGVGTVFTIFAGMSGAEIMASLAGFGVVGAVGGIASVAAVVAAPMVLAGGAAFYMADQQKLGMKLKDLFAESYKYEKLLKRDGRVATRGVIKALEADRIRLSEKHLDKCQIIRHKR